MSTVEQGGEFRTLTNDVNDNYDPFKGIDRGLKNKYSTPLQKPRRGTFLFLQPEEFFWFITEDLVIDSDSEADSILTKVKWFESMKKGKGGKLFFSNEFTNSLQTSQLCAARYAVLRHRNKDKTATRLEEVISFEQIPFLKASFRKLFPKVIGKKNICIIKKCITQKIDLLYRSALEKKKKGPQVSAQGSNDNNDWRSREQEGSTGSRREGEKDRSVIPPAAKFG